jgi:hypothetical protein
MYLGSRLEWVLVAVACVFAIVLFPAPARHGPFNAVYGPTTDLRSSIDVHQALPLMLSAIAVERSGAPCNSAQLEMIRQHFLCTHVAHIAVSVLVLRC